MNTKNESKVYPIAFMGIMAAINVVLILISFFVPVLSFLLIMVLPLTSTFVTLKVKYRYYPIYALSSILISILITISQIDITLLYLIPSLISGFIFGFSIQKKIPGEIAIVASSLSQLLFTFILIIIVKLFNVFVLDSIYTIFNIVSNPYKLEIVSIIFTILCLVESSTSYLIIKEDVKRFNIEVNENLDSIYETILIVINSVLLSIFAIIPNTLFLSFILIIYNLIFVVFLLINLIKEKNKIMYIFIVALFLINIFVFALLYNSLTFPYGLLLINNYFLSLAILVMIKYFVLKCKTNI